MLVITALYTSILAFIMLFLAYKTSARRTEAKINLGTGNDDLMERRSRAFGNFIEFVPMFILLMAMMEVQGYGTIYVHILGITTVVGRILHALGMTNSIKIINGRFVGAILAYLSLLVAGAFVLYMSASQLM